MKQTLSTLVFERLGVSVLCLLLIVLATAALAQAQQEAAAANLPSPQLVFTGKDGNKFNLSVANRKAYPDFMWLPSSNLPACGNNTAASRTWVEIFGSPGNKRIYGFCSLGSSADLANLWFAAPEGSGLPACVYIVMTDRKTGKKYVSNRVCSRLFTAGNSSTQARNGRNEIHIESFSWFISSAGTSGTGKTISAALPGRRPLVQPDLIVKEFQFPPTNDKALRVHVVNQGNGPAGPCRLLLIVRKINGVAVGRQTHLNVPALAAGQDKWLVIDAKNILPNNVALESTTFRLNVDGTTIVLESNENNNEVWHNL